MDRYLILVPLSAIVALIAAWLIASKVLKSPAGNGVLNKIASALKEGVNAFIYRQSQAVAYVAGIIIVILAIIALMHEGTEAVNWWWTTVGFAVGFLFSGLSSYAGLKILSHSSARVARAAEYGLNIAFKIAVNVGAVSGLSVTGLALLGVAGLFTLFHLVVGMDDPIKPLLGFAFGAALISIFVKIGGVIYSNAVGFGTNFAGKAKSEITGNDPRDPAVIAGSVGDNVDEISGTGTDLFDTYTIAAIGAAFLGYLLPDAMEVTKLVTYPLYLCAIAIFASIISIFLTRLGKNTNITKVINKGIYSGLLLSAAGFVIITYVMFVDFDFAGTGGTPPGTTWVDLFLSSAVGLLLVAAVILITEYYSQPGYGLMHGGARVSEVGSEKNTNYGLSVGMESTLMPTLSLILAIFIAFTFAGIYGIGIAAVAMLSFTGVVITLSSHGLIAKNAVEMVETRNLSDEIRGNTENLESVGHTTKAIARGFAIGSAALATLVLFKNYIFNMYAQDMVFRLDDPIVLAGILFGGMLPFIFVSLLIKAIGKAGAEIKEGISQQLREITGTKEEDDTPGYGSYLDIATKTSLRKLMIPGLIAVLIPLIIGLFLGPLALGGLLIGVIVSGLMVALMMFNSSAWTTIPKSVNDGNQDIGESDADSASRAGNATEFQYNEAIGSAISPLIKIINIVALIFAGMVAAFGGILL